MTFAAWWFVGLFCIEKAQCLPWHFRNLKVSQAENGGWWTQRTRELSSIPIPPLRLMGGRLPMSLTIKCITPPDEPRISWTFIKIFNVWEVNWSPMMSFLVAQSTCWLITEKWTGGKDGTRGDVVLNKVLVLLLCFDFSVSTSWGGCLNPRVEGNLRPRCGSKHEQKVILETLDMKKDPERRSWRKHHATYGCFRK